MGFRAIVKIISCVVLCLIFQHPAHAESCVTVESLKWLLANWQSENNGIKTNESWKQISEKTFEGFGYTYSIEKDKIVSSETLRLVEMSKELFYVAKVPNNNLPVSFKLTTCSGKSAVFENVRHDFPKKISYELNNENNITVYVSGENDKGFSIKFNRE